MITGLHTSYYWEKREQLYCPQDSGRHPKLLSHASNPLPIHLEGDVYRIFYSGRDEKNRSSVGAVDLDIIKRKVVQEHYEPFFAYGCVGSFYQDGVSLGNCYQVNGVTFMLFMGWQNPKRSHWRGDIGRLIVKDDLSLEFDDSFPVMTIDDFDSISLSYPWVQQQSNTYHMWYGSTLTWDCGNNEMLHVINHAISFDGKHWGRKEKAIPYQIGVAQAFSRPTVFIDSDGIYNMWFSYRGNKTSYRIGYAISLDGVSWELALQNSNIDISQSGWDSEMIEYPYIFKHKDVIYMLYNGNGYGRTGFGIAEAVIKNNFI